MKKLVCELCGSVELVKEDGFFVCQSCGCKYTLEEARKMMIEGVVEVKGTIKIDNSEVINNYLGLANNANEASNYDEAEKYSNMIIEINHNNYEAWYIKGVAAIWQSNIRMDRIKEGIDCFANALEFCNDDKKEEYKSNMIIQIHNVIVAVWSLKAENFGVLGDEDNYDSIINLDLISNVISYFENKLDIIFNTETKESLYDEIANYMNIGLTSAWKSISTFYNVNDSKDNQSTVGLLEWLPRAERCLYLADKALRCATSVEEMQTSLNNISFLAENIGKAKSYKLDFVMSIPTYVVDRYINDEARSRYNSLYSNGKKYFENKKNEIVLKYWINHPEEKQELLDKKNNANKQIELINKGWMESEIRVEYLSIENNINDINNELRRLGMFDFSQKKSLNQKKDMLQNKLNQIQDKFSSEQRRIEDSIIVQKRIIEDVDKKLESIIEEKK